MGNQFKDVGAYFDSSRTKRNLSTYDRGGEISEAEAAELLAEVDMFKLQLETWVRANFPALIR